MKKVVIITHSKDHIGIQKVSDKINALGLAVLRVNTDQYPTQYYLDAKTINQGLQHCLKTPDGQVLNADEIHSIWYRRFFPGKTIDSSMEAQMRSACVDESKHCFLGFLTCQSVFTVDDYWAIRKASIKDWQLQEAMKLGIDIPKTLVTNDPDAVREFYKTLDGNIITKMQSSFAIIQDNKEQVVFTNKVQAEHLAALDGLHQCPMIFQEAIEKEVELRVIVVGSKVFCAAIDSSQYSNTKTDWRKMAAHTLKDWQPYALPSDIEANMLKLTRAMGLKYGAIDIIVTPGGEYKFLEINPCGEFYWLEHHTGFAISDAFAELLVKQAN